MKTQTIELVLTPEQAFDPLQFEKIIAEKFSGTLDPVHAFRLIKRSIDARGRKVVVRLLGEIVSRDQTTGYAFHYKEVANAKPVVIVGAGPAGLFAALRLIEAGIKPIVIERGKDVQARRRDIAAINKDHVVNPESNYCFGEGGAGTYSDGKLYTRSTKRGDIRRILEILIAHGAPEDIRYDAHPHIGTNKLPVLVQKIRQRILDCGGEVRFNTRVTSFQLEHDAMKGVMTAGGDGIAGEAFILATGHSARDIFEILHRQGIQIEAKPFAMGVRVEHPQDLIDQMQYHGTGSRGPWLHANSGIVVAFEGSDISHYATHGPLAGMNFQRDVERTAWEAGGRTQTAPAQRLIDFVEGRISRTLPDCSYQPGLASSDVSAVFPDFIAGSLKEAFRNFGTKMKGYLTNDALVLAVESRTSSPVRIPRDPESLEHIQIKNLYPCGEGAGYAGGIVSAAMDGERCAEAVMHKMGVTAGR